MKTSIKKIIFALIVCIFSTVIYAYVSTIIKREKNELLKEEQPATDLLTTQEKDVWEKLAVNGIHKNECDQLTEEIAKNASSDVKDERHLLPEEMLNLITEVLQKVGIDPNTIIISLTESGSPAMTMHNVLYIDVKHLASYAPIVQKFIIAHEAHHIINKDYSRKCAALKLIQKTIPGNWQIDNPDYPLNDLEHFQETRADTQAAMKDQEYAQGYIAFVQTLVDEGYDEHNPGINHPKSTDRLAIAQNIYQSMNA